MLIDKEVVERVAEASLPFVEYTKKLQLASIAKSIEQIKGCQIFIEPFYNGGPSTKCEGCLATCEPYIVPEIDKVPSEKTAVKIRQHFIFYKPSPSDNESERFRIAHELGHCALHWPLGDRKVRKVAGKIKDVGGMYIIEFLKEEEMEADAFACLLGLYRPAPKRDFVWEVNNLVFDKIQEYNKKGLLQFVRA